VGGLNGVVVRFGIAVKIFFHRKEATDIVTFGIKRDGGESPGNSAVAFDKGVNGHQYILANGRSNGGMGLTGGRVVEPINQIGH